MYAVAITSLYAVTDEFHQMFVEGRSCELRDWAIDTCAAVLSGIIFLIIYKIVKKIATKRSNKAIQH